MSDLDARAIVAAAMRRGLLRMPRKPRLPEAQRAKTRLCMRRLRAELRGRDTSGFPPRVRKLKRRGTRYN